MDSDLHHHHHQSHFFHDNQQQNNHQKPMGSGLTRYQSAPSSYFSAFLDRELCEEFLNRPSSPETERIFARFLANTGGNTESLPSQNFHPIKHGSPVREAEQQGQGNTGLFQQQGNFINPTSTQGFYQSHSRPPPPQPPPSFQDQSSGSGIGYRVATSMGMERLPQTKIGSGGTGGGGGSSNNNSNLVRHSSSPAGFFANISIGIENGYPVMRSIEDYGARNNDTSYSAASRPLQPSSGRMSPIAEIGSKNMGENSPANVGGFGEARRENYVTGFPIAWDDSAIMEGGDKGFTNDDRTFSGLNESENQGGEAGNAPRMLAHHLSLQRTSAEMAALEKILQLQDSVPCKIRAKRGCATHPRSIAERVRRTRISERMRKLQDLVPNMDKQTNTADMLDLAVDYIKELQSQVKTLNENRAKCMCTNMQQQ